MQGIQFETGIELNDKIKTEKMNAYYKTSLHNILKTIPKDLNVNLLNNIKINEKQFKFKTITEEKLVEITKKFANKNHVDGISGNLIIDAMENRIFRQNFTELVNESLTNGTIPELFKVSIIEPIEKVKNAIYPEDFRPINKLPIMEKILESVVKIQLDDFIEECDILTERQSGFRSSHSCETAVNNVLYEWSEDLETGELVLTVTLDFKRAFETLDIELLLKKLDRYGIRQMELKWFRNYLMNRKQKVKIGENISEEVEVASGVSQGTCLAPLLYLIGVNDLPSAIKNSRVSMFADDTLLYVKAKTVKEAAEKMNEDLRLLDEWLKYNQICVNVKKTKYMIVTHKKINRDESKIVIRDMEIERVEEFKYLGVILDQHLSFMSHLGHVKKKLFSKLALFRRLDRNLTAETKILLYKSLVAPHFDYCSSILYGLCDSNLSDLQKIQNSFMRNILKVNKYAKIDFMLDALRFQTIKQRLTFNVMKNIYKIEKGMMPKYMQQHLKQNKIDNKYNTRRRSLYQIPNFTKDYTKKSIFYKGLKNYNDLKKNSKKEDFVNLKSFCKRLNNYVKDM